MGRIYETLRDAGIITLDCNLLKGDWNDQSVYNNPVSVVGTPTWSVGPQGWGLGFPEVSYLNCPASATFQSPKTLVAIMSPFFAAKAIRIISLRLTTTDIELFINPIPTDIRIYNGTGSGSVIRNNAFSHMVIVPNSGFACTNTGINTFTPMLASGDTNNCYIGGSPRVAGLSCPVPIYRAMLLNQPLTQNQAQDLLKELQSERYPTRTYSYQKSPTLKLNPTHNAILASNLQDIKGRTATDMSTNNKPGTLVGGCFNQANGLYIPGGTSGYVNFGNITELNNTTKATIYVVADPRNDGVNTFAPYVSRGTSDTSRIGIYHGDTTTTVQFSASNGSNGYKQLAGLPNKINHLCLSYDGGRVGAGERVHTYVDGKKVDSTLMAEFPASLPNITADLRLGQFTYATSLESRNKYKFVGVFAEALNDGQVREIYKQFSRVINYVDIDNLPTTVANITVANSSLPNTPFRLVSGQWSITSKPKAINCVAAGTLVDDDNGRSLRTSFIWSSGVLQFGFTSVKGAPNATGQNAYWCRISSGVLSITESVSGTETQLHSGGTIVAGTEYNLHFIWEFDGTLKLWYKKNNSINWDLACSASDTTIGTNSYLCVYSSAASNKVTKEIITNEITLTPEEWGGDGKIVPPNVLYDFDADDYSTTNEVLSGPLSDTGWVVLNDGFKISNSSGKNWLESTRTASIAYRDFGKNFYGTFYFSYINNSGANREISIMLNDIPSFTGSNGYQFQINNPSALYTMYRYISGSYTTLLNNNNVTTHNNLYYFCITRDNNGIFKLYIKGGAYTNWTLPPNNTVADTTYSYINYLAIYFDGASIKMSDVILLDQVINPIITPELLPNI